MRTIQLESLIFRTVVDEGGAVRAANKLNRVQSNVTTRIRQLEEHLGTRLFRRAGRSIRLSAEGHTLLTYADRLLRLADETVSEMRTGKPKGVFRLGALESTAGSRLAPILSRYHSVYPDVVVELATGTTGALVTRVVNFELEAAFVAEPFTAPSLRARCVFEERPCRTTGKLCSWTLLGLSLWKIFTTVARTGYPAFLKSPICASNARLKAGRAVQRST
jgi:DNA-binding transcriptional LysR family regulator